jgi:hypothetical protein
MTPSPMVTAVEKAGRIRVEEVVYCTLASRLGIVSSGFFYCQLLDETKSRLSYFLSC